MIGRIFPLALTVGGLIASASPAVAAEGAATSAQGSTATVSFVDDRPRTISYEDVVAKDGLKLLVHNDAMRTQDVTVRVIGLTDSPDPAIQTFLSDDPVVKKGLPPGGSALALIPLSDPSVEPGNARTYSAVVVANGETGGLARVPLTLTASADGSDAAPDPDLSPTFAPDLTLTAVNYLPSPLGATRPTLLLLVALSALAALLIKVRAIRRVRAGDEPLRGVRDRRAHRVGNLDGCRAQLDDRSVNSRDLHSGDPGVERRHAGNRRLRIE